MKDKEETISVSVPSEREVWGEGNAAGDSREGCPVGEAVARG